MINLDEHTEDELYAYKVTIYRNVVTAVSQLIDGIAILRLEPCDDYLALVQRFLSCKAHVQAGTLTEELYATTKALWSLPVVKKAIEGRCNFHLLDCAEHFLDDLDRLYAEDYVPTEEDILTSRTVTYGVNELRYTYSGRELRFIDVGGQKSERRKWVSVFDSVNAIIFFAAISEYDQFMSEDTNTNRLIDAIRLFNDVGNNPLFLKASLILFLNKKDLFQVKVKKVPLKVCFPDYKYKQNYKNASEYICRKFQKQMVNPDRNIYTHLTCAKDRDQMKFLTGSISDMIIANLVKGFGQVDKD
ncbi:guanine nucleotide-binding protein G(o) subunit alpha isoform 3 [Aphelenchoides avenae]|nr:guanine nucleotide-binding protein G(o) subunit alpha isoform 3 [Aphelenchus avenae]